MTYPRKVSNKVKEQMIELNRKGHGHASIGRILNLHKTTVRRHLKDLVLVDGVEFERVDYVKMKIKKLEKQLIEIERNNMNKHNTPKPNHPRERLNETEHLTLQELLAHYQGNVE